MLQVSSWATHQVAHYANYGKMASRSPKTTIESMLEDRQALIGTPEEVVEQLKYHLDVFGDFEPSMQINFGGIGDKEALRTLELFASRVMPSFPAR